MVTSEEVRRATQAQAAQNQAGSKKSQKQTQTKLIYSDERSRSETGQVKSRRSVWNTTLDSLAKSTRPDAEA